MKIAVVCDTYEALLAELPEVVGIIRDGNHLWCYVRDLRRDVDGIFSDAGLPKIGGINPCSFRTAADLLWKIVLKKKRFDVIVTAHPLLRFVLKFCAPHILPKMDQTRIQAFKDRTKSAADISTKGRPSLGSCRENHDEESINVNTLNG